MSLEVTVLGCDGGYPGPGGAGSGYLVRSNGVALCLDAGPGVLARVQQEIALEALDAVVVSHEHPDHASDLDGLAVALHFAAEPRRVPVYAPRGVRALRYFADWPELDWQEVADGDTVGLRGLVLRFSQTDHGPETLAVRVDGGGTSLGYSADTGPEWSFEALGGPLDLALCEATWTRQQEGRAQHLSGRQAGRMARGAGATELVVTHRWPTLPVEPVTAEASEAFGAPVRSAHPGARYTVVTSEDSLFPAPGASPG
ncbi:MAG: MBL fold metallo-hydrolase [Actinomycetes bacterium]